MTRACTHPLLDAITWHAIRNKDGSKDRYAIAGSIGGVDRYTVARIGTGEGERYECWRIGQGQPIALLPSADDARQACEIHHAAESDVHKLTRRDDLDTSRMAAERTTRSGKRQAGVRRAVETVRANPGATSAEIAQMAGMDRVEAARRLPDAREQGLIHNPVDALGKPVKRRCGVAGTPAITWLPGPKPLTESQEQCLLGAA